MLGFFIISPSRMLALLINQQLYKEGESMDTIIEAINELRQKLLSIKGIDYRIAYNIDTSLKEAAFSMECAKKTIEEHKIEM
jgi:hypothetical protein